MKSGSLNARSLRLILILVMILIVIATIAGFYFSQQQILKYANDVSQSNSDAAAGGQNLATLRNLDTQLDQKAGTIEKAKKIVAESKDYVYQDQIIKDIADIGNETGVDITGFSFTPQTAGASAAPTGTSAPSVNEPAASTVAGSTLKSQTVTVTIDSPLSYNNLMKFIKRIEQNSFKMQIANVSITGAEDSEVSSEAFSIEVYVR